MDHQTKTMIVNALIKIVDDAPTRSTAQYTSYLQKYAVNKDSFDIWVRYIFSIMQIISSFVDVSGCVSNINHVIQQQNPDNEYSSQVYSICQIILNFARTILYS